MESLKEGYVRQGKRKHSVCFKERVNGDGELIVIIEILEMNNCRKHSPFQG